jgi:phosphotransferase system IIA component
MNSFSEFAAVNLAGCYGPQGSEAVSFAKGRIFTISTSQLGGRIKYGDSIHYSRLVVTFDNARLCSHDASIITIMIVQQTRDLPR